MSRSLTILLAIAGFKTAICASTPAFPLAFFFKSAEDFTRIEEYLWEEDGEVFGNRFIVRSEPSRRSGLYYVLQTEKHLRNRALAASARFACIHASTGNRPRELTFALASDFANASELWIGLTDRQYEAIPEPATAWKLEILDAEGNVLLATESFLWSAPER